MPNPKQQWPADPDGDIDITTPNGMVNGKVPGAEDKDPPFGRQWSWGTKDQGTSGATPRSDPYAASPPTGRKKRS